MSKIGPSQIQIHLLKFFPKMVSVGKTYQRTNQSVQSSCFTVTTKWDSTNRIYRFFNICEKKIKCWNGKILKIQQDVYAKC